MLLADALQDAAGTPYDVLEFSGGFYWLATEVRRAKRIELEPAFADAANEMALRRPSRIRNAISLCRTPWPTVWIEMPFRGLGEARKAVPPATPEHGCRLNDSMPSPERFGLLMRTLPGRPWAGEATFAWRHSIAGESTEMQRVLGDAAGRDGGAGCELGRVGLLFDFRDGIAATAAEIDVTGGGSIDRPRYGRLGPLDEATTIRHMRTRGGWGDAIAAIPEEVAAVKHMCELVTYSIPIPVISWFNRMASTAEGREQLNAMRDHWEADVSGEAVFVMAILALLNAPGVVELALMGAGDRLNEARLKLGKRPLLSYVQARLRGRPPGARADA